MERVRKEHDAPIWAIAAVLGELVDQKAWLALAGVSCETSMELGRGARQGALGTPPCETASPTHYHQPPHRVMGSGICLGVMPVFCSLAQSVACRQRLQHSRR